MQLTLQDHLSAEASTIIYPYTQPRDVVAVQACYRNKILKRITGGIWKRKRRGRMRTKRGMKGYKTRHEREEEYKTLFTLNTNELTYKLRNNPK